MIMDPEEFNHIITEVLQLRKETEWVEFKVNNIDPQEIGEYISALSNSACLHDKEAGYIIWGVNDVSLEVVGTTFSPDKEKVGNQQLENWIATQLEPRIDFKIYEGLYEDKKVVVFEIQPTVNTPVKFKGSTYIRVGSIKKKLSDFPEKERAIWMKRPGFGFEIGSAIENLTEDEVLNLIDYPTYFELMALPLPNNQAIIEKLIEEKIVKKVRNRYCISNMGAILFAKDLRKFDTLSRKTVRVIQYKGTNKLKTIKEQEGIKGYAVGFKGLITYINDKLPTNEEIGKVFRREVKIFPELAIRELVANALIHQDFSQTGTGPMIEIFEDRIEISNPGNPLIDTLRFIDHSPKSRNEKIAFLMRRANICEERGSGIDKVIAESELYQLPAPEFIEEANSTKVILYSPRSLRQMDKQGKIRACYQHACLKYVSGDFMTNQTLRERFNIDEKNYPIVSRIISDSVEARLIKSYDPENKSRKYVPFWV